MSASPSPVPSAHRCSISSEARSDPNRNGEVLASSALSISTQAPPCAFPTQCDRSRATGCTGRPQWVRTGCKGAARSAACRRRWHLRRCANWWRPPCPAQPADCLRGAGAGWYGDHRRSQLARGVVPPRSKQPVRRWTDAAPTARFGRVRPSARDFQPAQLQLETSGLPRKPLRGRAHARLRAAFRRPLAAR